MPSKKATELVNNLRAASKHLTETGAPELAATIDELLLPQGWGQLRHAIDITGAPNLPVHMPLVTRTAIQAASKSVPKDVAEGLNAFIAGTFSPVAGAHRVRRNTGLETGTLNVRVDSGLRARFQEAVDARESDLGYKPALGHVVKAWLIEKYDIAPAEQLAQQ
ncbi:hypothetical protein [Streptomyces sp. NBC_01353]|uniref:hypothetical protein n=1 Tax=Streptomyces sp. NBC_01353 TaxID=2903835 RepID=UPI002E348F85|nr:hypothetical protein [Streptomyces sp. NBC_01353]